MPENNDNQRAIVARDMLNKMIELEGNDSIVSAVIACALACAVEELEKFIYGNGTFTPSVVPANMDLFLGGGFNRDGEKESGLTPYEESTIVLRGIEEAINVLRNRVGGNYTLDETERIVRDAAKKFLEMNQQEMDLADRGEKIQAIKNLRARIGCGLKEAKTMVDKYVESKRHNNIPF